MAGPTNDTTAQGPQLRFVFKGRGIRLTEEIKRTAEHKLSRLGRMEPRATLLEIEVVARRNPRLRDAFLVEGALMIPRATFRAHAEAPDIASAVDRLAERLERQVRDHHSRRRTRPVGRSDGLESAHA